MRFKVGPASARRSRLLRFAAKGQPQFRLMLPTDSAEDPIQRVLRQHVWEAAHIQLNVVTIDADATVHTVFKTCSTITGSWRSEPGREVAATEVLA